MRRRKRLLSAIITTLLHGIIGNVIGISSAGHSIWGYPFFPYSFIAGMSDFAGWDSFSIILEAISLGVCFAVFYLIASVISMIKEGRRRPASGEAV